MRGRAAAAVLLAASLMPWAAVPLAGAAAFGVLTVTAPGWQLLVPPAGLNYSRDLFQMPGDLNGDGFDDLVLWQSTAGGGTALTLANGTGAGLDIGNQWTWYYPYATVCYAEGCPRVLDAGNPSARDTRPAGLDFDGDGRGELLYQEVPSGGLCVFVGFPAPCQRDFEKLAFAFGPRSVPTNSTFAFTSMEGDPPASAYLLGKTRPDDTGSVLVEQSFDRADNGTVPAYTQFTLVRFQNRSLVSPHPTWTAQEPTPLSAAPRPPHFIAAPDFDRDGLSDIVTWSPPAPAGSTFSPGLLTIYNGTRSGPNLSAPAYLNLEAPNVVIGDFDGNGHADIAEYRPAISSYVGSPVGGYIDLTIGHWWDGALFFAPTSVRLSGPSIFASQPPVKLQAGDVDGDGKDDLVAVKYDTTSATSGHLLVDVFLNVPSCTEGNSITASLCADPSYSTEIQLSGSDIYSGSEGVRINAQADFDGDGRRDITVGYLGGNAPDRTRTSTSGFVAVLYASTVMARVYGVTIDADQGGLVYPLYRNYTVTVSRTSLPYAGVARLEFTNLSSQPFLEVNLSTMGVASSDQAALLPRGNATHFSADCALPCPDLLIVPLAFNWSFPPDAVFGITVEHFPTQGSASSVLAASPRASTFEPRSRVSGSLAVESRGASVADGGWVAGAALVNLSNVSLTFLGPAGIPVPPDQYSWIVSRPAGVAETTAPGGDFLGSLTAPPTTTRGWAHQLGVAGIPAPFLTSPLNFSLNVDADPPQFGAHLPLESEWVTSSPTFVAVDIFDNESGVDPDRVEVSWENDGAPFVRWDRATALPGQTLAEVVATALINFPEGNLSNVIWRAWDSVGNGPSESPIFGIKVDTLDITFADPLPPAALWQSSEVVNASVRIQAGSSGVNWSSLEFRISTEGPFGFGPWSPYCGGGNCVRTSPLPDPSRSPDMLLHLVEGDANWIQWRASSHAAGVPRVSDPYQIRVDSLGPVITSLLPNETALFPLGGAVLTVTAHEGSPQGVAQRGLDTTPGGATYRVRGPGQTGFGLQHALPASAWSPDLWTAEYAAPLDLSRGNSTVEVSIKDLGGQTTVATTTVRINQNPTLSVVSTPQNFTVEVNGTITLAASGSDPDSSNLAYAWAVTYPWHGCSQGSRLPAPTILFSRNVTVELSPNSPECVRTNTTGDITILLTVRDSLDGAAFQTLVVHVVPQAPPPTPPPPAPQVVSLTGDNSLTLALLLMAGAISAVVLIARRRREPPENV